MRSRMLPPIIRQKSLQNLRDARDEQKAIRKVRGSEQPYGQYNKGNLDEVTSLQQKTPKNSVERDSRSGQDQTD